VLSPGSSAIPPLAGVRKFSGNTDTKVDDSLFDNLAVSPRRSKNKMDSFYERRKTPNLGF
jgi:hypothetical protein